MEKGEGDEDRLIPRRRKRRRRRKTRSRKERRRKREVQFSSVQSLDMRDDSTEILFQYFCRRPL